MARVLRHLVSLVAPPLCTACGAAAGGAAPLCRPCRARMGAGARVRVAGLEVWAGFPYDGPAGAVVRSIKFGGRFPLADVAAAQLVATAPPELLDGVVVPVPLHPARLRRRGFNQSRQLAAALARRTGLELSECLRRVGDPRPQVGRGRVDRIAAMDDRIALVPGISPPPAVLLVDDVVTTGATLAACARVLRRGGSGQVRALAYARTSGR